jgi:hypothetical protein
MWQTASYLFHSAQAGDQFAIFTWYFFRGWHPLGKFLFIQGPDRIQVKSGVGTPEMHQKGEPCTRHGIKLICGLGP